MQYRSPKQRWCSLQILFRAGGIVRPPPEDEFKERPVMRRKKTQGCVKQQKCDFFSFHLLVLSARNAAYALLDMHLHIVLEFGCCWKGRSIE